jgi:antirestriction protein ArdC
MKNEIYETLFAEVLKGSGKMLKGYSNFHRYSFGNQMYAMWQMMGRGLEVSPIGTFKKWQSLGRNVMKGQKAIELCMPVTIKDENDKTKKKVVFVYRKNWFAMSQTEGKDLEFPPVAFDYEKALRELNIVKESFKHTDGNAQGYAQKGIVAINPLAELPLKTLFHEIAHNLLHLETDKEFIDTKTQESNIAEVEAEGVALCVSLALGLEENVPYCVGYIKNWLGKGNEVPADSIKKIFKAADKILKAGQEKPVDNPAE